MIFNSALLTHVPALVLAFMTPERVKALIKAVSQTIDFVSTLNNDDPADDYKAAENFMMSQYDLLDSVANLDSTVDATIKSVVIPYILAFIYSDGSKA